MTYGYDDANRLTSVTDWNSNSTAYSYDDAGRMTTATLPSGTGIVSTYAYDNADRLTGISHVKNGSTTVASVAYTLDDVGNRTQRVDQQGTHTYAYDDLHRLTSVTYPGPSTTTYDFDAFGNRTEMTVGSATTTYSYDDADRLTAVTPPSPASAISYTWDDNGNLTARGSDSFSWDYEDRMVSATVNSVTTTFAYRGDGLRNSRTVGGNTTTFTWDIASGLTVVLDDGNQYVYGVGLTSMKQSGNWYYYLTDGLGSTMAIVDASGNSQKSYQYDVYGEVTGGSGSLSQEFDFAGQQTDATGLQYLRARYYDPATGTFLSREPLATGNGWLGNSFAYGGGNPVRFSDPSGLFMVEEGEGASNCTRIQCGTQYTNSSGPGIDWGSVVGVLGDGAVRLVKLAGEYSLIAGDALWKILSADPALTELVLSGALGTAVGLCAAGVVTAGATCVAGAMILGVYAGWKISGWLAKDGISANERAVRTVIEIVNAYPGGGLAKAIFDALTEALEPRVAE